MNMASLRRIKNGILNNDQYIVDHKKWYVYNTRILFDSEKPKGSANPIVNMNLKIGLVRKALRRQVVLGT